MSAGLAGRRLLFVTYYGPPYVSGLTEHVRRIAAGAAAAGAHVQLIVGRHDRRLPARDAIDGVHVRRLPVAARLDRGILVPALVPVVLRAARRADAVVLVTPLAEAGTIARLLSGRTPLALSHVCDPQVPGGLLGRLLVAQADASARAAARRAQALFGLSADYARHSRVLGEFAGRVVAIAPPVELEAFAPDPAAAPSRPAGTPLRIGSLGRLTHEKGLDRLIDAVARLERPARLVLAGPSAGVAGGGEAERLRARAARLGVELELPGALAAGERAPYLRALDVFVLPSVSSLEAWGIAQVEAMLCGTPVVASALPGVREPLRLTGMGVLAAPGDVAALAGAIDRVAADRASYVRPRAEVIAALRLDETLDRHVAALASLAASSDRQPDGTR